MKGVLTVAIYLLSLALNAQLDILKNYNVKEGLPSSDVYCVMQDSKGFIWASGDLGVSRFNGYEFKNFDVSNGLADNMVFNIHEDHHKRIWFTSVSARLSFFYKDSIYQVKCNDTLEKLLKHYIVNSIYVDKGDTVWLGINTNFLFKISPGWRAKDVKKIEMPNSKYICEIERSVIFGGESPSTIKIKVFDKLNPQYEIDDGIKNGPNNPQRFCVTKLKDASYLASVGTEFLHFSSKGLLHKHTEKSAGIYLHQENDGSLLCTTYLGAIRFSGSDFKNRSEIAQLSNKVVTTICVDSEDETWIGSEGHGLFCIPFREFKYYTPKNGLPDSKITCVGVQDSLVVAAHANGQISVLYKDSIKIIRHIFTEIGHTPHIISQFKYKNELYLISERNVFLFKNNKLDLLKAYEDAGIKRIIGNDEDGLWASTYAAIIKLASFKEPKGMKTEINGRKIANIFSDSDAKIWLCTMLGIYKYDGAIKAMTSENPLYKYRCSDITQDQNKNLWFATKGGGILIKRGEKLQQIGVREGLASNLCKSILIDSNIVWVGTNKGLSRILIKSDGSYKIDNIDAKNGLETDEVNSILKRGTDLWIIHNNGISIFNPNYVKNNTCKPPVYLTSVTISGLLFKDTIAPELEHDQNFLIFNYIGLSYKNAGNIQYRYKLEGLDTGWSYTKYTQVNYQTIPPGRYKFLVYASNNDGIWSNEPAVFSFTVFHAWWQTWSARIIIVASLIIVSLYIFKLRLNKIRKREEEKILLKQRIGETELQALRAQMNPHFIFNSINSVQYFMTENDAKSSQKYLAKFAKLIRYVVDNSKPAAIPLATELEALNLYLELEALRFENQFEYAINLDDSIDVDYVQIPSMLIQPYIENSIWHGLMHKKEKGRIDVNLKIENNILKCTVIDNGIGRTKSAEINTKNGNAERKSFGMSITKERLDIINQITHQELSVRISDVLNEKGEVAGTKVELSIPIS
jgi:ligand-binding sensor domain-containing protein